MEQMELFMNEEYTYRPILAESAEKDFEDWLVFGEDTWDLVKCPQTGMLVAERRKVDPDANKRMHETLEKMANRDVVPASTNCTCGLWKVDPTLRVGHSHWCEVK